MKKTISAIIFFVISAFTIFNVMAIKQDQVITVKNLADKYLEKAETVLVNGVTAEEEESLQNSVISLAMKNTPELTEESTDEIIYKTTYSNIQAFKEAIQENFPEKSNLEIGKEILINTDRMDLCEDLPDDKILEAIDSKDVTIVDQYRKEVTTGESVSINKNEAINIETQSQISTMSIPDEVRTSDDGLVKMRLVVDNIGTYGGFTARKIGFYAKWLSGDRPYNNFEDFIAIGTDTNASIYNNDLNAFSYVSRHTVCKTQNIIGKNSIYHSRDMLVSSKVNGGKGDFENGGVSVSEKVVSGTDSSLAFKSALPRCFHSDHGFYTDDSGRMFPNANCEYSDSYRYIEVIVVKLNSTSVGFKVFPYFLHKTVDLGLDLSFSSSKSVGFSPNITITSTPYAFFGGMIFNW